MRNLRPMKQSLPVPSDRRQLWPLRERGAVSDPELLRRPAVWGQAGAVAVPVGSPALSVPFGASCRLRGSFDATPVPCKAVSLCCFIIVLLTNELLGEKFLSGSVFVLLLTRGGKEAPL